MRRKFRVLEVKKHHESDTRYIIQKRIFGFWFDSEEQTFYGPTLRSYMTLEGAVNEVKILEGFTPIKTVVYPATPET